MLFALPDAGQLIAIVTDFSRPGSDWSTQLWRLVPRLYELRLPVSEVRFSANSVRANSVP